MFIDIIMFANIAFMIGAIMIVIVIMIVIIILFSF
jgi:hypothetical protein